MADPVITITAPTGSGGSKLLGSDLSVTWTTNIAVTTGEFGVWYRAEDTYYYNETLVPGSGGTSFSTTLNLPVPATDAEVILAWRYPKVTGTWTSWATSASFTVDAPTVTITTPAAGDTYYDVGATITSAWTSSPALSFGEFSVWVRSGANIWVYDKLVQASGGTSFGTTTTVTTSLGPGCHFIVCWRPVDGSGDWYCWATSPGTFTVGIGPRSMPTFRPDLLNIGVGPLSGSTPAVPNPSLDISSMIEGFAWDATTRGGLGGASGILRVPAGSRSTKTSTNLCPYPEGTALAWWTP